MEGRGLAEGGSDLEAGRGLGLESSHEPSVRPGARPAGGAAAFPKPRRRRGPAGCAGQIPRVQSRHGMHTGSMCTRLHAHLSTRLHIHSTHAHTGAVLRSHGHTGPLPNPTIPNSQNPGWGGSGLSPPMSLPTGLFQPAAQGPGASPLLAIRPGLWFSVFRALRVRELRVWVQPPPQLTARPQPGAYSCLAALDRKTLSCGQSGSDIVPPGAHCRAHSPPQGAVAC